jgi:hypothetical protein
MKAVKIVLVSIVTLAILTGLSNTAVARTNVSVGIGLGYPAYHQGWYHHSYYGPGWGWRHHHPYGSTVVIGGGWWWPDYYYPDYYVVPPPPVVVLEKPPAVIEQQAPVVQPQTVDEDTQKVFRELRFKKSELLRMLEIGDKASRIKAIRELAGFTFDDKVRRNLEKVLFDDSDPELRVETARALGELKNPQTLPALEKARIQDSSQEVRQAADQAIKKIEGN